MDRHRDVVRSRDRARADLERVGRGRGARGRQRAGCTRRVHHEGGVEHDVDLVRRARQRRRHHRTGAHVGAVVGATYPEIGKVLREIMPKAYILVPGYGAQGGKGSDLVHYFNKDGLGAIVNSSRGIIAAYKQPGYEKFGEEAYADASRQAVLAMKEDIMNAIVNK